KKRIPSRNTASHERPVTQNVNESVHQDRLKNPAVQQTEKTRPVTKKDHMKQPKLQQQLSSLNKKEHLIHVENPNQPIKKGTRTLNEERTRPKNGRKTIKRPSKPLKRTNQKQITKRQIHAVRRKR